MKPSGKRKSNNDSQVRFHGDVRVKKIKATGKNRSLHDDDLDDDDDEYMFDGEDDSEDSEDQNNEDSDDSDLSDEEMEEDPSGTSEDGFGEGTTIQRFKHDLFAEEEEEENDGTLSYPYAQTTTYNSS